MSDSPQPRGEERTTALPGPPPPLPDLAAVSASIDPPATAPTAPATAAAPASAAPAAAAPAPAASPAAVAAPTEPAVPLIDAAAVPSGPGTTERAPSDVTAVPAVTRVPGAAVSTGTRYGTLPTAPVATSLQGPLEGQSADWESIAPRRQRAFAGPWALTLAILALAASFFVGWMLPLGLVAIVVGIVALRRPVESRAVTVWAIVLGALSVLYSAGWLMWAAPQLGLSG